MPDETPTPETPAVETPAAAAAEAPVAETPVADAPPAAPVIDPAHESVLETLNASLGAGVIDAVSNHGDLVVRVAPEAWAAAAKTARDQLGCDFLSFVAGIDWMPMPAVEGQGGDTSQPTQPTEQTPGVAGAAGRFQVFAHVQSTSTPVGITFKTDVADTNGAVDSWVPTYPGADWHERETWEMYGIDFTGHPAIRHLYLPNDFEGNPLKKDFPLLAREVKPWPGIVNVEAMPGEADEAEGEQA
ncbi:MAG: NADH-quinone oxidoreductase subunit C [Acidimicrobiia bacterium]